MNLSYIAHPPAAQIHKMQCTVGLW